MPPRTRLSEKGNQQTVYVEHGVWYDTGTNSIHVTIPGLDGAAHWSYRPDHARYALYKQILETNGRWPDGARE